MVNLYCWLTDLRLDCDLRLSFICLWIAQTYERRRRFAETAEERKLLESIDQRFMSDLDDGPDGDFIVRPIKWRSEQLLELIGCLDEREQAEEEAGASHRPAPRHPRTPGPPSERQPPKKVSAAARWALRSTEHRRKKMLAVAHAPRRAVVDDSFWLA